MRTSLALLLLSLSLAPAAGLADGGANKLLANGTGKTVIRKIVLGNDITVAVLSRSGTAVVADPWRMPPGVVPDAITVTYGPHLDKAYLEAARAAKALVVQTGSWKVKDVQITGVAAGHSKKPIDPSAPEVVIYVYEVDGLRIADLSCIVQPKLEPEQLKALGPIDVALITGEPEDQAFPSKAARDSGDLVKQLGARIVIPLSHHYADMDLTNEGIAGQLGGGDVETVKNELVLSREELKGSGQKVVHIEALLAP